MDKAKRPGKKEAAPKEPHQIDMPRPRLATRALAFEGYRAFLIVTVRRTVKTLTGTLTILVDRRVTTCFAILPSRILNWRSGQQPTMPCLTPIPPRV